MEIALAVGASVDDGHDVIAGSGVAGTKRAAAAEIGIAAAAQEGYGVTIAIARGVTACPRQGCRGVAAGDNYKAASLENAARRGRVAAVQIGASASEKIFSDLANIDAVRAAAHTDPTSPTGAAVARLA
jgi:hypothetical protein